MPEILAVEGLAKTFTLHVLGGRRVVALRDATFAVPEGAFLGVVGPSGGGKSSLLKCLYRTYLPSAGTIRYRAADGAAVDLASIPDDDVLRLRRREIGYVSQFL